MSATHVIPSPPRVLLNPLQELSQIQSNLTNTKGSITETGGTTLSYPEGYYDIVLLHREKFVSEVFFFFFRNWCELSYTGNFAHHVHKKSAYAITNNLNKVLEDNETILAGCVSQQVNTILSCKFNYEIFFFGLLGCFQQHFN